MIRSKLLVAFFIGAIFLEAAFAQNSTVNATDSATDAPSGDGEPSVTTTTEVITTTSDAVSATPAFVMFASFLFVSIARNLL